MSTEDVVPSPVMSSCAVATRAIIFAVGFWICISYSSVCPSLVSLMSPAPETSILSVPGVRVGVGVGVGVRVRAGVGVTLMFEVTLMFGVTLMVVVGG